MKPKQEFKIETPRLIILPPSERYFDHLCQLESNPEVMRYISKGKPRSKEKTRTIMNKIIHHYNEHGFSLGAIFNKESGEYIGRGGLIYLELNDTQPDIEVGYALFPRYWGKGYATEVAKACVDWGFKYLNVDRLVGIINPKNHASRRVLEKAGMILKCDRIYVYWGVKVDFYAINRPL